MAVSNAVLASWLRDFHDDAEKTRVLEIGQLTGLKEEAGRYYPANFERGLLLREIVRRRKPKRILELGTGRGLGILCMADRVRTLDYLNKITLASPAAWCISWGSSPEGLSLIHSAWPPLESWAKPWRDFSIPKSCPSGFRDSLPESEPSHVLRRVQDYKKLQ